jgi:hypothetical protein
LVSAVGTTSNGKTYIFSKLLGIGIGRVIIGAEYALGVWIMLRLLGSPW